MLEMHPRVYLAQRCEGLNDLQTGAELLNKLNESPHATLAQLQFVAHSSGNIKDKEDILFRLRLSTLLELQNKIKPGAKPGKRGNLRPMSHKRSNPDITVLPDICEKILYNVISGSSDIGLQVGLNHLNSK